MPEGEPHSVRQFAFGALDRAERLTRVGAFVVAVFEDEVTAGRPADVVDLLVKRLDGRILLGGERVAFMELLQAWGNRP
jgi:hypothetical protein